MSENFSELKRLFNAECSAMEQQYINAVLEKYHARDIKELERLQFNVAKDLPKGSKDYAVRYVIAKMLAGYSISQAKDLLYRVPDVIQCSCTIDASNMSFTPFLKE